MRVGIDARSLTPFKTGIGIYLSEILECWSAIGSLPHACLFSNREIDIPRTWPVERQIVEKRLGLLWYLFQSHRHINRYRPEIFWGTQFLIPRKLSKSIPVVVTIADCVHRLGIAFAPSILHNLLHRYYIPVAIKRAAKILTISQFVADEITQYYGASPERIEVTPLGVNPIFRSKQIDQDRVKQVLKRHGIAVPYILGVGTLEPRKNTKLLLEAYTRLSPKLRESYGLVLVGKSGWKAAELKRQILAHTGASRIQLVGYLPREDLPYIYAAASMFVFPSFYEGFGLPVLEAMAAGCPVISSSSSSLKEVVGDAGLTLSPHGPVHEWSELIEEIATNSNLSNDLRVKGLARAESFSWSSCATRTFKVLQESASPRYKFQF